MTIALSGQINLSALNVPQPVVQIVPPQFLFNGVSTNVTGYVGTSSWGPVDTPQTFGSYAQYAQIFGPTVNRYNDMGGHIILGDSQGAGYFCGVRVTDGSDTAASATVLATGATKATGTLTFSAQPGASSIITINGTVWTFVTSFTGPYQILIATSLAATLATAINALNASADTNTATMTYSASATVITATAVAYGTGGNSLTLQGSVASNSTPTTSTVLSGGTNGTTGVTLTGKFTGSLANGAKAVFLKGTAANSYKVVITCPPLATEIFDSVGQNLTGAALWTAIVSAINNGTGPNRPPSNIVTATVGAATTLPILTTWSMSGGSDGVTSITTAVLLGQDSVATVSGLATIVPRTGMYALRSQGVAQFGLCDCTDITSVSTQIAFGIDIGSYVVMSTPMSDTLSYAQNELSQYGIDSFVFKGLFGDWIVWNDTVTNTPTRWTSPAAVTLGLLGNMSPQRNTLNKPLNGFIGTQSSVMGKSYSYSDLQALALARLDVICVDKTISNNFIHRLGINSSSNPITMGDEYPRVIFFLAKSIQIIAAQYIGANMTSTEMTQAKVALQNFLALAQQNGIIYTIDTPSGVPGSIATAASGSQAYQVVLDNTNNTAATAALGYQYAYVKAIIGPIVRYFIVNLEGGSSVTISNTPPGQ